MRARGLHLIWCKLLLFFLNSVIMEVFVNRLIAVWWVLVCGCLRLYYCCVVRACMRLFETAWYAVSTALRYCCVVWWGGLADAEQAVGLE